MSRRPTPTTTLPQAWRNRHGAARGPARPGLVLVFSAGRPCCEVLPLVEGRLLLGREEPDGPLEADTHVSRRHAEVLLQGATWNIRDLGSRNGTAVDGALLAGGYSGPAPRVLRVGESLLLPQADVRPFVGAGVELVDGQIVGPASADMLSAVSRAAHAGRSLHITGESGAGKELVARAFHRLGPRASGPFIAVNCAAIPEGLAERLLFGARKGAYSGATDSDGHLQSADGGTLFLDEIAELALPVQAKLLRAIETQEVVPLGASKGRSVDFHVCTATHRSLREEMKRGRFRHDLFFRIGRPDVALPPLRERACEIPHLIAHALLKHDPERQAHASLVEACLLKRWPGNVRELFVELRAAALSAASQGARLIEATHLSEHAGEELPPDGEQAEEAAPAVFPAAEEIRAALERTGGNVTAAARVLGLHRNQLRRWLAKEGQG